MYILQFEILYLGINKLAPSTTHIGRSSTANLDIIPETACHWYNLLRDLSDSPLSQWLLSGFDIFFSNFGSNTYDSR